jgi:hypothetical protein
LRPSPLAILRERHAPLVELLIDLGRNLSHPGIVLIDVIGIIGGVVDRIVFDGREPLGKLKLAAVDANAILGLLALGGEAPGKLRQPVHCATEALLGLANLGEGLATVILDPERGCAHAGVTASIGPLNILRGEGASSQRCLPT